MPKYLHPDVLDNGLQYIIDMAAGNVDLLLINGYTQGDSYATVDAARVMTINLAAIDMSLGNQGTLGRRLTVVEKSGTASANATTPDLHVAIVDVTNSKVLAATDETGDADVAVNDPKTIPTFDIRMNQPV
jgi:hypothetical protein